MDFYAEIFFTLFGQDQRFAAWQKDGIPEAVGREIADFWKDPELAALRAQVEVAPRDLPALWESLRKLSGDQREAGGASRAWVEVADRSELLAARQPEAAVVVALQAMAAWVGALGPQLFMQPWEGHHPGWHVFPLAAGRAMVAARAIWGARLVCETAAGFVEAAKLAPSDPRLRSVVAEYREVLAGAERIYGDSVSELAWALSAASGPRPTGDEEPSFRPHLAALFWTAGDVIHAELLGPQGPAGYEAPYPLVRELVDHCMVRLPRDPLIQYIWLEMKDRGPFDLRQHLVLFGHLNNRFRLHPLHAMDELFPFELGRLYARALIGLMKGRVEPDDENVLRQASGLIGPMVEAKAPDVSLRLRALLALLAASDEPGRSERWQMLAGMSAQVLGWADRGGIQEPFHRVLDGPLYYLPASTEEELRHSLAAIEAFRSSNLGYWLAITPPPPPEDPGLEPLLGEERQLLTELRGARFIRMLPLLPRHYRRYGFRIEEAELGPPVGAAPSQPEDGILGFDPFDQSLAERELRESLERLEQLYTRMAAQAPKYAASRATPPSSEADFEQALQAHSKPTGAGPSFPAAGRT